MDYQYFQTVVIKKTLKLAKSKNTPLLQTVLNNKLVKLVQKYN